MFLPMDSFINQKEIAEGRERGRKGEKEGRLCSRRVKRRLSAEGQRCLLRAVTSGCFTAAPSHWSARGQRPWWSRRRCHRRDPNLTSVVGLHLERLSDLLAPPWCRSRNVSHGAVRQTKPSDDFERRSACQTPFHSAEFTSTERRRAIMSISFLEALPFRGCSNQLITST